MGKGCRSWAIYGSQHLCWERTPHLLEHWCIGLCRVWGVQGHPVMDCFGSHPYGAVAMAWDLFPATPGVLCSCPGPGSWWCVRIQSLMLSTALSQGDFAMTELLLLMVLVLLASLNRCLLPTERVKRPLVCPVCLM